MKLKLKSKLDNKPIFPFPTEPKILCALKYSDPYVLISCSAQLWPVEL